MPLRTEATKNTVTGLKVDNPTDPSSIDRRTLRQKKMLAVISPAAAKKLCFFFIKLLAFVCFLQTHNLGDALPIDTTFTLPSPLPQWPPGGGFGKGEIDLGGLLVRQVSTFRRIWRGEKGGVNDQGASFFEPGPIPEGFSMLGSYGQPNARQLFGWVLVGKASANAVDVLKQPTDYTLVYTTLSGDPRGYFWLPVPPDGYRAVGYVVTTSPDKPDLDKIRCVRSDFTDESEIDSWVWGPGDGANMYSLRPKVRGANAQPVGVGVFYVKPAGDNSNIPISCLKSKNSNSPAVPNLSQVQALFQTYSPYIYMHPKESFLPSSVDWFFSNGALLYKKGEEGNPVGIQPNGMNLPQGGNNDGLYWIDLPRDKNGQDNVKKGDLQSAETYLHVKSVLGGTFTDIQVWVFYPFNGPATAKVEFIKRLQLGKIGEHVGDWEHVTLRISNFDGTLYRVFFAQHSRGQWVDSCQLEFQNGNKFVGYVALNSHASYYQAGLVLLGDEDIGVRDETDKSGTELDAGKRYVVVGAAAEAVVEPPPWLGYNREWGPNRSYELGNDVEKVKKFLPGKLKSKFGGLIMKLPDEIFREEGPTGPKMKSNWIGDEEENIYS